MEPFISEKRNYDGYKVKVQRTNGTVEQLRDIGPAHHDGKIEYQLEQLEPTTQYHVYVQTYRGKRSSPVVSVKFRTLIEPPTGLSVVERGSDYMDLQKFD